MGFRMPMETPLGMSRREFLDWVEMERPTLKYHSILWGPGLNEKRKQAVYQHSFLSASLLQIQCDQLPHAPDAIPSWM